MTKSVRVDEMTYAALVHMTGDLMAQLEKPLSLGMTIRLAMIILEYHMGKKEWSDTVEELRKLELPSPVDWMKQFDVVYRTMTQEEGQVGP